MRYHLIVYVPLADAQTIRGILANNGVGKIGNYDSCSFSARGIGRFRALKGADPYIGKIGTVEEVEEERIEAVVPDDVDMTKLLREIRKAHPYEQPAIHILPMADEDTIS
ncbi:MAG: hypothetical protein HOO67_04170 [Candidatus Peribacteraceae bacterium]|nr:hypothetical protein [Candidatus Peribacteraceae bacterium]